MEKLPGGSGVPRWPPLPPSRRAVGRFESGLEQDLHRVVLLFLEDVVAARALQRQLVGVKALDPKGSPSPVRRGMNSSTQRLTLACPMVSFVCLSKSVSMGSGSACPP